MAKGFRDTIGQLEKVTSGAARRRGTTCTLFRADRLDSIVSYWLETAIRGAFQTVLVRK